MRTRLLIFCMFSLTLFALATLITLIFNTAPVDYQIISAFYVSAVLSVFGLIFLAAYGFVYLRNQSLPSWRVTSTLFRFSFYAGLLSVMSLLLRSYKLLNFATLMVLITALFLAELFLKKRFQWQK